MAKKKSTSQPLTFDLPFDFIAKIEASRRALALRSTSEVVRVALESFNFSHFSAPPKQHRQISVRVPADVKAKLVKYSRQKKVSVGELLRVAIGGLKAAPAKKSAAAKRKKGR